MIHPHTYIHPNAKLATNVKVDPFTVIHQDVEVGDGYLDWFQCDHNGRSQDRKELPDISRAPLLQLFHRTENLMANERRLKLGTIALSGSL